LPASEVGGVGVGRFRAILILLLSCGFIGAAPANPVGTYAVVAVPVSTSASPQAFQINTVTGAMKFCTRDAGAWKCFPIEYSAD
jgi:hypothetical protein